MECYQVIEGVSGRDSARPVAVVKNKSVSGLQTLRTVGTHNFLLDLAKRWPLIEPADSKWHEMKEQRHTGHNT